MALPEPITRLEKYWAAILDKIQGGGSSVTVEPLTVTQNGTKTAPSGKAYSPVTVDVPNSYGASDEGKVVNNGALVAQTAHAPVTQNGTIDTTLYNSVPVNVDGNPNYVETISGTVANPWGERFAEIKAGIAAGSMTCFFNGSMGGRMYVFLDNANGHVIATDIANYDPSMNSLVMFGGDVYIYNLNDGALARSYVVDEGEVLGSPVIPTNATTLTIIHHPLPDSE